MHKLKILCTELSQKTENIKKAINRPYARETIINKHDDILFTYNQIQRICAEIDVSTLDSDEFAYLTKLRKHSQKDKEISIAILKSHLSVSDTMDFKFETGLKLPTLTNDQDEISLRDFLDIIKSYYDTLSDLGQDALIKFVCLNRIQGKAKTRLGSL